MFPLTPEQETLRARARELADTRFAERAARWDATEEYPWDNVKDLVAAGFMGMTVPASYGGGERPLLDVVLVIEEIARACGVTARIVVEGNLGTVGALVAYGTAAQKRRYFPWVLEGEKPAIAITEVEAGSAATDLTTRADETASGFRLTGHKRYITGAWAPPPSRSASPRAPTSARSPTRPSVGSSGARSAISRGSAGSWPTWPSSSTPRVC